MKIDTGHCPPIASKPYRAPLLKREFIENKVEELLKAGIISESQSPWAAPVVVVKKKSGEEWLCIDYRKLNSITVPYSFPLPNIDDILAKLGGSKFFSTLNLKSGYYQLPLDPESRHKTSFVCHAGIYQFNKLPFGLCSRLLPSRP